MTTPALITTPPAGQLDTTRLAAVDTATLRDALRDGLRLTVSHLAYVAAIWRELESRGENLAPLAKGIGAYLSAVGSGDVLPETVVNFAGRPALLKKVAALPPAEQRDIADGKQAPPELRQRGPNAQRVGPSVPMLPGQPARNPVGRHVAEPSDDDLDAACETRQPKKPLEMLAAMLGQASPGDAAELVAECVAGCPSAQLVAMRLIPLLQELARGTVKRPLAV